MSDEPNVLDLLYEPERVIAWILAQLPEHPATAACPDPECLVCGYRDCPLHEPLHYHHDGCPAEWAAARHRP